MVMLNYSLDEMNNAIGKKLKLEDYERIALKFGLDLESKAGELNFEVTSDRVDIVSKYSLASVFASQLGVSLRRHQHVKKEKSMAVAEKTERGFVNAIHVKLDDRIGEDLAEIISMQERLDKNIGRNRKKAAIGFFDYNKISFPVVYGEREESRVNFVPLGYSSKKTYREIVGEVKQGKEYAGLYGKKPVVWSDSRGDILALLPVINSNGYSVNEDTRELFVDITGTDKETVNAVTKILIYNLQFLGEVSQILVKYSSGARPSDFSLGVHRFYLNESAVESMLGVRIGIGKIKKMLSSLDYGIEPKGKDILVSPPFYRQDIMHQVDIIDDVMRVFGVEKIPAVLPHSYTDGEFLGSHYTSQNIREILAGFGYQEIDLNVLTNEKYQFGSTGIDARDYASLLPLKSGDVTMAGKNLFPELLRLISNNLHKKFPQRIFSLSNTVEKGTGDTIFENRQKLSVVACEKEANVTDILSIIKKTLKDSFLMEKISLDYTEGEYSNAFIKGRAYTIYADGKQIGVAGEVHPKVLNAFGIELPIALAEIYVDRL